MTDGPMNSGKPVNPDPSNPDPSNPDPSNPDPSKTGPEDAEIDPHLTFTVATVWREERISCPHPHVLQSWLQGGLDGGAAEFVQFHLDESQCPYCNAVVQDLRTRDAQAKEPALEDLRDRLLRSTVTALRRNRA